MTSINIILLGESGVGKTTLLLRFQTGEFKKVESTCIPIDDHIKNIVLEGKEISLHIWDTAGQERYRSVSKNYYREKDGVLLVYDVTNLETYYKLAGWLKELRSENENLEILIAGNKNDDPSRKAVAVSTVQVFARDQMCDYVEISALTGERVEEAFLHLARKILIAKGILSEKHAKTLENVSLTNPERSDNIKDKDTIRVKASVEEKNPKKKKSCC